MIRKEHKDEKQKKGLLQLKDTETIQVWTVRILERTPKVVLCKSWYM